MKITFISDNHYGSHGGLVINKALSGRYDISFAEDDYTGLIAPGALADTDLLMTAVIGDTCNIPHAGEECEPEVRAFLESGKPVFLVHGGSASFWQWDWWRETVGLRWVRPGDPEGVPQSTHPVIPFDVSLSKSRHPLISKLKPFSLTEKDELYIELEVTRPILPLMEASHEGKSYPMAYSTTTRWGGEIVGFLPGHRPEVTGTEAIIENCAAIIDYFGEA